MSRYIRSIIGHQRNPDLTWPPGSVQRRNTRPVVYSSWYEGSVTAVGLICGVSGDLEPTVARSGQQVETLDCLKIGVAVISHDDAMPLVDHIPHAGVDAVVCLGNSGPAGLSALL